MRQIEAAKSSRKVVKQDFSTTGISASRIPYAALPGQQKNRPLFAAGVKFAVQLSCPEHLLAHLGFFLFTRQFFLLFPGVFQLLHPSNFLKCVLQAQMRVRVHRHADVAVTHKVLERLRVHACPRLNAAVSMAAYMGRNVRHQ